MVDLFANCDRSQKTSHICVYGGVLPPYTCACNLRPEFVSAICTNDMITALICIFAHSFLRLLPLSLVPLHPLTSLFVGRLSALALSKLADIQTQTRAGLEHALNVRKV